ncbi:Putative cytochrome P450 [Septoria linicola]|uniref:Cytochrome P450 n=1 Tax=Septoria linicola TaxID=215465 RepID=A0A9Q9B0J6_9PEZI|nr:Putative cytochrome P450 [Septoria linicola]
MSIYESNGFAILYASIPPCLLALVLQLVDFTALSHRVQAVILVPTLLYLYAAYKIGSQILENLNNPLRYLPASPDESFLFGHARATWEEPKGSAFLKWMDTIPNEGLIYYAGFFRSKPHVFAASPEAMREVLITHAYDYKKPELGRKFLEQTAGRGLLVVEGNEHKIQRKSVSPAFSGKHVRDLVPIFWNKARELTDILADQLERVGKEQARTGVIELNGWASRATIDIICAASLGRDFNSLRNPDDELALQYKRVFGDNAGSQIWILFDLLGTPPPIQLARWTPYFTKFREAAEGRYQLRPLCRGFVGLKRKEMESGLAAANDILSVLIRSGEFTDDGLVDQLLTYLAAGHETTSSALAFTCWILANNDEVQKRLRNELKARFPRQLDEEVTASDLDALPYLDAVISEQLRLYPSAPILPREAVRDTTILGHRIPKDQFVLMCPWAVNRSKKLWGNDAQDFKPERWLTKPTPSVDLGGKDDNSRSTTTSPMRFLTFLHGPRSCIGQTFSRAEQKCLVAAMVMRFEIRMADPNENIMPAGFITIKPMGKDGLRLMLRELQP